MYLVHYQKMLTAEPDNIEARLRLAAIFRELGRTSHAVQEYVTASKLLAKEGLPLEAIAACKAVLELEPEHAEIKYFLARLFAQVPDAMSRSSRIAQPLDSMVLRRTPAARPAVNELIELSDPVGVRGPRRDEGQAESPNTALPHQPTKKGWFEESLGSEVTTPIVDTIEEEGDDDTSPIDSGLIPDFSEGEVTRELAAQAATRMTEPDAVTPASIATPELLERASRDTDFETFETFEVNVFDLDSLGLDESSEIDFSFLDQFEGEVGEFLAEEVSETYPATYHVARAELPEIPLLSRLPPEVFMRLLSVIDVQRVPVGTAILQPNHTSRSLFIVVKGRTRVTRDVGGTTVELDHMVEGEFFGEFALLTGRTGSATVSAITDCELLAIHEEVVNDIADEYPEIWDILWEFYYARMLNNLLASSAIFRPLSADEREALVEHFEMREVVADQVFLKEGELCRDLYLVLNGEVSVEREIAGQTKQLAVMHEGEFFGVASSLNEEPYLADVRAERDTTLLLLPAEIFRAVTNANPQVGEAVDLEISSRRRLNQAFTSGITEYAERGVAKFDP